MKAFDGAYPAIGSWLVGRADGAVAAGIGIREGDTPVTTNRTRFVPRLFG